MPLSWNEIRQRAIAFSHSWSSATRERAEAQTFWNEFFDVFGLRRRTVASFEEPVRNLRGRYDFIDLFWRGKLIAEHKSRGGNLSRASSQAMDYIQSLAREARDEEIPRYLLLSDFARFALHDLERTEPSSAVLEFELAALPQHIRDFAFIAGYETRRLDPEDPANVRAVELLGNLHDNLEQGGYRGHDLERFLVRILFCLFADDTGIFEPEIFKLFLLNRTRQDGSDLGSQLARLFAVLNTPGERRQRNLDEDLAALPYVNGDLFAEALGFPEFNAAMRTSLLICASFHWEKISPAVFGALFQSIMDGPERRQIGAHYTSERDILKLIRSLFLDDLRAEFETIHTDRRALERFHRRLGDLRLLDPACGCGNFLVISYRELRRLEMDVLQARFGHDLSHGDVLAECRLGVEQMYGIELEEWPVRIAEVAMWLIDHQMNTELFERFGQVKPTTPLTRSPTIRQANALRIDWNDVLPARACNYVLGNPPFVGKRFMTDQQNADMAQVAGAIRNSGVLDYVTPWYLKAAEYARGTEARCAFVSTNSITQGEQVGVLWPYLFARGIRIHFGHRTFSWQSEARGRAHVHVVIVGFSATDVPGKHIYDYEADPEHPTRVSARQISPYLAEGGPAAVTARRTRLCPSPDLNFGSMPNDGGHLLLENEERVELLAREPQAAAFARPFLGSQEFINGLPRWCLWLVDATPSQLRAMPEVMRRVELVRSTREVSSRATTRELARTPALFGEIRQPARRYLAIPKTSSERRLYIPMGFLGPETIASTELFTSSDATTYHFGVLSSAMHMAWVRHVCGRLKSDYRYSSNIVYNNFPWPQEASDRQRESVEQGAARVLAARQQFQGQTLADLYDPLTMPPVLAAAHAELDRAVDRCYRVQRFGSDRQRFEHLFALYESLVTPLTPAPQTRARRSAAARATNARRDRRAARADS